MRKPVLKQSLQRGMAATERSDPRMLGAVLAKRRLLCATASTIAAVVLSTVASAVTTNAAGTGANLVASPATVKSSTVHQLSGGIYEFYWVLKTGPGQYDQVGVHRVVQD
jgi:hypothetical protein